MVANFENEYVMLPQDRADHINERHVELNKERGASKFYRYFNLTATLAYLTRKTFRDSSEYEIIENGFKDGHGYYFIYVFHMRKEIGVCPWGFPTKKICIYFSWRREYGDKFKIISAYPFSPTYHEYLTKKKMGLY